MKAIYISVLLTSLYVFSGICHAQDVTLYTPRGSIVYALNRLELTPAEITLLTEEARRLYPNATVLSNASRTYNCHSYAWNLREGGINYCWVNQTLDGGTPNLSNYWNDNSYVSTTEVGAQRIFYYEGDHSAVRSGAQYESKWGTYPIMRHDPGYGPSGYVMNKRRYYIHNVRLSAALISSTGTTVNISNTGTFRTPTVWTHSSNLELVSSNNTSAVFKSGAAGGLGWVKASFNGQVLENNYWVGKPKITNIEGNKRIPNRQYASFQAVYDVRSQPTSFEWILNPQKGNTIYNTNTASVGISFNDAGFYQLVVRATNANGTGEYYVTSLDVYNTSSYSYQVYPVPASNILNVNFNMQSSEENIFGIEKSNQNKSFKIYLYNERGNIVRQTTSDGLQIQFDVSNLQGGMYYLHIDDGSGDKPEIQKVIIKH